MPPPKLVKAVPTDIRSLGLNEKWVQDRIAEDVSQLGLGDLYLKDIERPQPRAGRLDLLLQDTEEPRRFEVELQLGASDECHIIRCIEYWDLERKRYPQYEHTAVLIAEDITSRFLNVIGLFNGQIPLVALQMKALRLPDESVAVVFTKVLDTVSRGLVDEDEKTTEVANRKYWEARTGVMTSVDRLFGLAKEVAPNVEMNYLRGYIGVRLDGIVQNFFWVEPKRAHIRWSFRVPKSTVTDQSLAEAGLEYKYTEWNAYQVWLRPADLDSQKDLILQFLREAHQHFCT